LKPGFFNDLAAEAKILVRNPVSGFHAIGGLRVPVEKPGFFKDLAAEAKNFLRNPVSGHARDRGVTELRNRVSLRISLPKRKYF